MKKAARRLYNRNIIIKEDGKRTDVRWITKKVECDGSGVLSLRFSQEVIPYLSEITGAFTKYKLKWVAKFKCSYSIRLYELMAQWKGKGTREIGVDELREMLAIGNKYPKWGEFRRNVVDKAVEEITQHSNLDMSYGIRKSGRKVVAVQFSFRTKTGGSQKRISGSQKGKDQGWKSRSREDVGKLARPGEKWDELYARLDKDKKGG
jgi:plasmid replication initiation protein